MILRPSDHPNAISSDFVSAWEAVAQAQRAQAADYCLVHQPDHAQLSGELAQRFAIKIMPPMTDEIVRGISLHDEGWSAFDCGNEKLQATLARYSSDGVALNAEGKPLSFLDIKTADFLRAWRGSIAAAEAVAPIAALMVSGHFYRLAKLGSSVGHYSQEDGELVRQFVEEEERRQAKLRGLETRTPEEIEYWIDVLQFCDLLSLYLCCGSEESVEFPQRIAGSEKIRLRVDDGVCVMAPSLFAHEAEFTLQARQFPESSSTTLKWTLR